MSKATRKFVQGRLAGCRHPARAQSGRNRRVLGAVVCLQIAAAHSTACLVSSSDYQNADLSGVSCPDASFTSGQHNAFRKANLDNAVFDRSQFVVGTRGFEHASLVGASMLQTSIVAQDYTFRGADLAGAVFSDSVVEILGYSAFDEASLRQAEFSRARLSFPSTVAGPFGNADFTGANAIGLTIEGESGAFYGAKLIDANFADSSIRFEGDLFDHADLRYANFSGAEITARDFASRQTDLTGANFAGAVISSREIGSNDANFTNANFSGADISSSARSFRESNFTNADFSGATFDCDGVFHSSTLVNANFSHATIRRGVFNFYRADLTDADFSHAVIGGGSPFTFANLTNADLTGATFVAGGLLGTELNNTDFSNADLTRTRLAMIRFSLLSPPRYNSETKFPAGFDPVAGNWLLVPEPQSFFLLLLGSVGLNWRRLGG